MLGQFHLLVGGGRGSERERGRGRKRSNGESERDTGRQIDRSIDRRQRRRGEAVVIDDAREGGEEGKTDGYGR